MQQNTKSELNKFDNIKIRPSLLFHRLTFRPTSSRHDFFPQGGGPITGRGPGRENETGRRGGKQTEAETGRSGGTGTTKRKRIGTTRTGTEADQERGVIISCLFKLGWNFYLNFWSWKCKELIIISLHQYNLMIINFQSTREMMAKRRGKETERTTTGRGRIVELDRPNYNIITTEDFACPLGPVSWIITEVIDLINTLCRHERLLRLLIFVTARQFCHEQTSSVLQSALPLRPTFGTFFYDLHQNVPASKGRTGSERSIFPKAATMEYRFIGWSRRRGDGTLIG